MGAKGGKERGWPEKTGCRRRDGKGEIGLEEVGGRIITVEM